VYYVTHPIGLLTDDLRRSPPRTYVRAKQEEEEERHVVRSINAVFTDSFEVMDTLDRRIRSRYRFVTDSEGVAQWRPSSFSLRVGKETENEQTTTIARIFDGIERCIKIIAGRS